jgi:hypothetical protein
MKMDYLNVLDHLKAYSVDRIILSDFSKDWETEGTVTVELTESHTTVHTKSLEVSGMAEGAYIYTTRNPEETNDRKAFRLDDRENLLLHIYSDTDITAESLELILSDSTNLTTATITIDIPELESGTVNIVEVAIAKEDKVKLSNITSVGIKALSNIAATFNIALINATSTKYIATVEDIDQKIKEGITYVLSKLGPGYTTLPDDDELEGAVYLAAASYAWMKQKENEQYQFDYGNQTTTKNYGVSLRNRAKMIVDSFLAGGDAESGTSSESAESYINTDLIGYSVLK